MTHNNEKLKYTMLNGKIRAAGNSTFAIGGVSSPLDSFVVAESSVLRIKFSAEIPAHRQSANRWRSCLITFREMIRKHLKSIKYSKQKKMFKYFHKISIATLILVLYLCMSCGKPKYFNGTIEYQYTYESGVLNEDSLAKIKPFKSEFQYDNNNYQSRFFALDTTTYYYSGQSGKCISQINLANKFECEDYNVSTDSVLSFKEYETNEKVLGQRCKIIEWQGKYFYNVFYVSVDKHIAPNTYKNHVAYNWKFYGEKANGGLILKSEHRFKNYTMKGIAVNFKEEKRDFKSLNIDMVNFELTCK